MNPREHDRWLSRVSSKGLVVTAAALEIAEANLTRPVDDILPHLRALAVQPGPERLAAFLRDAFGWPDGLIVPGQALPETLAPMHAGQRQIPTFALRSADGRDDFVFLVALEPPGTALDASAGEGARSPEACFEHLLRESGVELGLLTTGRTFRLVYAPRGGRAGWLSWIFDELLADDGVMLGAFHMLLNAERLLSLTPEERLAGLVRRSRAYKIERLRIRDFGAFEDVSLSLVGGINVFIGANGTGKSHAMKALYAVLKALADRDAPLPPVARLINELNEVFKPDDRQLGRLVRRRSGAYEAQLLIEGEVGRVTVDVDVQGVVGLLDEEWQSAPSILFLPSREVLAMYEGFIAAYTQRELAFDVTYYDTCLALSAAPLRGPRSEEAAELFKPIEEALGGRVVLRGNGFYLQQGDDLMEAQLLAEGFRKIGSIARLIANGSLTAQSILFWDEPEANLNPKLVSLAVKLILDLAAQGVQVFVTTHDYLFSHKLSVIAEYKSRPDVPMRFFGFYRPESGAPVQVEEGEALPDITHNLILEEFTKHYEEEQSLFYGGEKEGEAS